MKTILFALCLAVLFSGCTQKDIMNSTQGLRNLISEIKYSLNTDEEWGIIKKYNTACGRRLGIMGYICVDESDFKRIKEAEYVSFENKKDRQTVLEILVFYKYKGYDGQNITNICAPQKLKNRAIFWADILCDKRDKAGAFACAMLGELYKYDAPEYAISKFEEGIKGKSADAYHGLAEMYAPKDYNKASVYRARGCRIEGHSPTDEKCKEIRELKFLTSKDVEEYRATRCPKR